MSNVTQMHAILVPCGLSKCTLALPNPHGTPDCMHFSNIAHTRTQMNRNLVKKHNSQDSNIITQINLNSVK